MTLNYAESYKPGGHAGRPKEEEWQKEALTLE